MNTLNLIGINVLHIFILAPMLIYLGNRNVPQIAEQTLVVMGLFIAAYHGYKWWNNPHWIRLLHVFIVSSLLIARGYIGRNQHIDRALTITGSIGIIYHFWLIWLKYQ